MASVKVASVNDLKDGQSRVVHANGKAIALFKLGGKFFAIDNTCLHMGGPLGEGSLEDSIVTCPLHGWQYDVSTGACQTVPGMKVNAYKVKVEGENVMVEV